MPQQIMNHSCLPFSFPCNLSLVPFCRKTPSPSGGDTWGLPGEGISRCEVLWRTDVKCGLWASQDLCYYCFIWGGTCLCTTSWNHESLTDSSNNHLNVVLTMCQEGCVVLCSYMNSFPGEPAYLMSPMYFSGWKLVSSFTLESKKSLWRSWS